MRELGCRVKGFVCGSGFQLQSLLGGPWDLGSKVVRTLIGVISSHKYS